VDSIIGGGLLLFTVLFIITMFRKPWGRNHGNMRQGSTMIPVRPTERQPDAWTNAGRATGKSTGGRRLPGLRLGGSPTGVGRAIRLAAPIPWRLLHRLRGT